MKFSIIFLPAMKVKILNCGGLEERRVQTCSSGKKNKTMGKILPTDSIRAIKRKMLPHFSTDGEINAILEFKKKKPIPVPPRAQEHDPSERLPRQWLSNDKVLNHIDFFHLEVLLSFRKDQTFHGRVYFLQDPCVYIKES